MFVAAVRSLGLSPAMAGKYLSMLESTLGTRLVQRTTRSLSLTDAGARYLSASKRIIEALAEADAEARNGRNQLAGTIRMSVPRTFGMLCLAPILAAFRQAHPRVTLDVHTDERYADRSEEHTSELQSLMRISYAVFCLKKKKKNHRKQVTAQNTY